MFYLSSFRLAETSELELSLLPVLQGSVLWDVLDRDTVGLDVSTSQQLLVLGSLVLGEAPLGGDKDLGGRSLTLGNTAPKWNIEHRWGKYIVTIHPFRDRYIIISYGCLLQY